MRTADFDFPLPPELIAQAPAPNRDQSRLLLLQRQTGRLEHRQFRDLLDYLKAGDVLVMNNSRVIPARLRGIKPDTGGQIEVLLYEENAANDWWVMLRPGKRVRPGTEIQFKRTDGTTSPVSAVVREKNAAGHCRLQFHGIGNILESIHELGEIPLPPYIERPVNTGAINDNARYQTVYAQPAGSVAAPTAGLHFTEELLQEIRARGVQIVFVTLHVGLGTFAPVKAENLSEHVMHEERFTISEATVNAIQAAKKSGQRVFAVGTTSVRVLETVAAQNHGELVPSSGRTRIFIFPPRHFKIVDALLTNFHLPQSTLLMLVSAFAAPGELRGREMMLAAYASAVEQRYRFFSYGDAMLIL